MNGSGATTRQPAPNCWALRTRLVLMFVFGLATLVPAAAMASQPARTAVMSAFGPELRALEAATRHKRAHQYAGVRFVTGELDGKPVVLFLSGVSMVNASRTTQLALDRFNIRRIVFSGVGGGVDPALQVGDVVVAEQWAEYLEMTFTREPGPAEAADRLPSFGMMTPNPVTLEPAAGKRELRTWFKVDPVLLAEARRSAANAVLKRCAGEHCLPAPPRIVVGGNGVSGSAFVDNAAFRQYAFSAFKAEVLDMESAAAAHVAYLNHTPFIAFRSLSDLAGGDPGANQFPTFMGLAADNAAATVRTFLLAAP